MKKVLFVCVENSCRSQMAKGFFTNLSPKACADSAGIRPAKNVDPVAVVVMQEVGIDISCYKPKMLSPDMNKKFDYIVTMGCMDGCPLTPKEKTINWIIEDPRGKIRDKYREIRDNIKIHIQKLIDEIGD